MSGLVLSLFPGIGLLDRGFEDEGFCVVRGPDLLWGGDVKKFHVPAGRFDGVIGGPPCQAFSSLRHLVVATGKKLAENLIPEYERLCAEAAPRWFVMENVPAAPEPVVGGYVVKSLLLNNRWCPAEEGSAVGAEQNRERRFSFGTTDGRALQPRVALFEAPRKALAVMANGGGVMSPSLSAEAASRNGGCFNAEPTSLLEPVPGAVIASPGRSFTTSHPDGNGGRRKNGRARRGPGRGSGDGRDGHGQRDGLEPEASARRGPPHRGLLPARLRASRAARGLRSSAVHGVREDSGRRQRRPLPHGPLRGSCCPRSHGRRGPVIARKGARVVLVREPLGWFSVPALGAVGTVERAFWGGLDGRVLVRLDGRQLVPCERKDFESATEDLDGIVLAIAREVAPRCRAELHALELLDEHEKGEQRVTRQLGIRWPRQVAAGGSA